MFYLFFFIYFATRSLSTLGDNHHNPSPKIRGPTPKNLAPKTCKIWGDFTQLPTLITNISGMSQISKIRKICDRERFLPRSAKYVRHGSLTTKYNKWVWTNPKVLFWETVYRTLRGAAPSNFYTHNWLSKVSLQLDLWCQAASSWALPHISSFQYIFTIHEIDTDNTLCNWAGVSDLCIFLLNNSWSTWHS